MPRKKRMSKKRNLLLPMSINILYPLFALFPLISCGPTLIEQQANKIIVPKELLVECPDLPTDIGDNNNIGWYDFYNDGYNVRGFYKICSDMNHNKITGINKITGN